MERRSRSTSPSSQLQQLFFSRSRVPTAAYGSRCPNRLSADALRRARDYSYGRPGSRGFRPARASASRSTKSGSPRAPGSMRTIVDDQRIAERRIIVGPVDEAMTTLGLRGPVALLGTPRSLGAVDDAAFDGVQVHRYEGVRLHNPRETVDEAGALVDRHGCASIVAIGSSSAIDLGKAVSDSRRVVLALVPTALGG